MTDTPAIHAAMIAVMRDCPSIGKDSINKGQGFKFRGIDAVYGALHSIMAKHGIYTTSEVLNSTSEMRQTKGGNDLIYRIHTFRYTFHALDGSTVTTEVVGEGMDSGDKASNKALAIAHKYALLQAFLVPVDDMPDPDAETPPPTVRRNYETVHVKDGKVVQPKLSEL